jgi:hypothetical protein
MLWKIIMMMMRNGLFTRREKCNGSCDRVKKAKQDFLKIIYFLKF